MMPLWTTQILPSVEQCGCELTSEGAPCVAQRVWPMPVVPTSRAPFAVCSASTARRPLVLEMANAPFVETQIPAES